MFVFRLLSLPYRQFLQFSLRTNIPPIMVVCCLHFSLCNQNSSIFRTLLNTKKCHFDDSKSEMGKMLNVRVISFSSNSKTVRSFIAKCAKNRSIEPRSGRFRNIPNPSIIQSQIKQNWLTVKAIFIIFYHFFLLFSYF